MYKLIVKLNGIKPVISRTLYVPKNIKFTYLDEILRKVFSLSYAHLSVFSFEGLNTLMWDFDKCMPSEKCVPMDCDISDYIGLFKKFTWTYDLSSSYVFTITVRKADKKLFKDYPFVESYEGEYDPIEDRHMYDFCEMIYHIENNHEMPDYLDNFDMEYFNIDKVNRKLKE